MDAPEKFHRHVQVFHAGSDVGVIAQCFVLLIHSELYCNTSRRIMQNDLVF